MTQIEPDWVSRVRKKVKHLRVAKEIFYYHEVNSTNVVAQKLVQQDTGNGTAIISSIQTAGRGRLGRNWESPSGGIWLSIVLYPPPQATNLSLITIVAAVAVARTVEKVLGIEAEIKWPNDILVGGMKVCGILCELLSGPSGWAIIAGVGINLNIDKEDLPILETYPAGSLKMFARKEISEERFMVHFFRNFNESYSNFLRGDQGRKRLLDRWRKHAEMLGKRIIIKLGDELLEGIAKDVDNNGYLVFKAPNGEITHIMAGDITRIEPPKE
ncbi:MAG: biotin--[acetyl-CoA-carboxylase] ligase [Candidatus Hodarchaeales archaeon]